MHFKQSVIPALLIFCLSYFCYQSWSAVACSESNTIYSSTTKKGLELAEIEAQEMRKRLSYMVFTQERKQSQKRLVLALQEQLNLKPWSAVLWRDYLGAISEMTPVHEDRDWALSVATKMLKWSRYERYFLLNRCIKNSQPSSDKWRGLCRELLGQLWNEPNLKVLLRNLQVEFSDLERAFSFYAANRPPWMHQ